MASPTKFQKRPDQRLVTPAFKTNPLTPISITGQGTQSHPVPPARITLNGPLLTAPTPADAPGASGTI